ncbi:MAG: hypothetical protein AMXMBFR7_01680 [Planctomycetota bacterium]
MAEQEKVAVRTDDVVVPKPEAAPPIIMCDVPKGHRLYEIMWVVDVNLGRENMTKVVDGLKELVEKSGGAWVNGDKWEERRLAYSIKKRKRGLYMLAHITCEPENVTKLERNIQISELVMRALIVKDEDGITLTPTQLTPDDDKAFGGFGGGGDRGGGGGGGGGRRFFGKREGGGGGGGREGGGGGRFDRGDRGDRGGGGRR